jgi:hypothetical protein
MYAIPVGAGEACDLLIFPEIGGEPEKIAACGSSYADRVCLASDELPKA